MRARRFRTRRRLFLGLTLVAVTTPACNRGGQPQQEAATARVQPAAAADPEPPMSPAPDATAAPKANPAAKGVTIEETTVATIDGWKVTVGNVGKGVFKVGDGSVREGITALVGLYDANKAEQGETSVGPGSELRIAGKRWRVTDVQVGVGNANGFVALEPVP